MSILPLYKGYQGSVEYDEGVLYIRILHIDDSVSMTCTSANKVISSFHDLVDDYIETCEALCQEPNKPFKGSFNVRITPELHRSAAISAAARSETLNSWVGEAISEKIRRDRYEYSYFLDDIETYTSTHSKPMGLTIWNSTTFETKDEGAKLIDLMKYRAKVAN
jgi:predicted HicB family RNase H-like nuclease